MTAIKGQNRIHSRSPFFINCVPSGGQTISSATLTLKVQTGSRSAAVTSMTDLATYNLSSTNPIDNIIVFDIAPIIADYFTHDNDQYNLTSVTYANQKQVAFVYWDKRVTDTGGSTDTSGYYVVTDGYGTFKEGVNWQPVTDATGNYGNPAWSPATAKRTERTIAATDCYRQMGESSYAILPIYMGEFDVAATDSSTFARVMFGAGEAWKTYSQGNNVQIYDWQIGDSDSRLADVRQGLAYVPIGYNNMGANWISGYDYLRVGHMIDRSETASGSETTDIAIQVSDATSVLSGANAVLTNASIAENALNPSPGESYIWTINAFVDCGVSWPQTDVTASYQSYDGTALTVSIPAAQQALVDCFCNTAVEVASTIYAVPIVETSNDIAIINDNPVIRYEIICEPKYNVVDAFFINKWGAWDCFTFLKASTERLSVSQQSYKKNIAYVDSNAYTYDSSQNTRQRYNVNGKRSITLNTGYVGESFNLLLEEMLLSEKMYLIVTDINGDEQVVPVNPSTTQVEMRRHVNESLINYTLDFEYAYDQINNVV
jgi:hypothetical protein